MGARRDPCRMSGQLLANMVTSFATFGTVAAGTSLWYMAFEGEPATSDDPYIIGVLCGTIVGCTAFVSHWCKQILGNRVAATVNALIYGLLFASSLVILLLASGESLIGAGIIFIVVVAAIIGKLFEVIVLRRAPVVLFVAVGVILGVATIVMLCVTPVIRG